MKSGLRLILFFSFMNILMTLALAIGVGLWFLRIYLNYLTGYLRDEAVYQSFKTIIFWTVIALLTTLTLTRDVLWKYYLRQHRPLPYHIVQEFQISSPSLGKKVVDEDNNQVYTGPGVKPRKSRGFSFVQTYGQSKVLEAYSQSPKLVAKPKISD